MNYVGKKMLHLIAVVLAVTSLTFLMVDFLPGDAAYGIVGQEATLDDIHALQKELGLTENIILRYFKWLSNAVSGNLGTSFITHESVINAIFSRLPVTIELMFIAQIIAITLTIPCAILCAYRPQSVIDKALTGLSLTTMSTPVFVMALVLRYHGPGYCLPLDFRSTRVHGCSLYSTFYRTCAGSYHRDDSRILQGENRDNYNHHHGYHPGISWNSASFGNYPLFGTQLEKYHHCAGNPHGPVILQGFPGQHD